MPKNLGVEVKRFELVELVSGSFTSALTTTNIKANFKWTRIWPLNYDSIMHDTRCSQASHVDASQEYVNDEEHVDGKKDGDVTDNILSLSQGH